MLLAGSILVSAGCGSDTDAQTQLARPGTGFQRLWLGKDFQGNALRDTSRAGDRRVLIYGECEIPAGQDEGGCAPPYQLQEQAACRGFFTAGLPRLHRGPGEAITFHEGGGIVVITGGTYVKIFGNETAAAARALRPVDTTAPRPSQPAPSHCRLPDRAPKPPSSVPPGVEVVAGYCVPDGQGLICQRPRGAGEVRLQPQ
jgi:hypothetical protein